MFSDDICSDLTAVSDWNLCCVGKKKRGGHKLYKRQELKGRQQLPAKHFSPFLPC